MSRRINAEGLEKLKKWEGYVPYTYDDADESNPKKRIKPGDNYKGVLTIGYGHTGPDVRPGMEVNLKKAEELLQNDLARFERRVEKLVKVPLSDNQFAALVSFDFNTGGLASSTLLKELNKGNYHNVPFELAKWNKATVKGKKVVLPGLANRRAVEAALWAKGGYIASNTTVVATPAKPLVTKESITWGAGILATLGSLFEGSGPVQWALGAVIVLAFTGGVFLFVRKQLRT
jgi:lysozyme